jgi:hypothetical protein
MFLTATLCNLCLNTVFFDQTETMNFSQVFMVMFVCAWLQMIPLSCMYYLFSYDVIYAARTETTRMVLPCFNRCAGVLLLLIGVVCLFMVLVSNWALFEDIVITVAGLQENGARKEQLDVVISNPWNSSSSVDISATGRSMYQTVLGTVLTVVFCSGSCIMCFFSARCFHRLVETDRVGAGDSKSMDQLTMDDIDPERADDRDWQPEGSETMDTPHISRTDMLGYWIAIIFSLGAIYLVLVTVAVFDKPKALKWLTFNFWSNTVVAFVAEPVKLMAIFYCGDLTVVHIAGEIVHEFLVALGFGFSV